MSLLRPGVIKQHKLYWLCMITLKIQKGFSTIYLLICNVIYYFSNYCKNLQNSWYVSVLVMCERVCYCAYFINVNKLYVHMCVLERAKHSFFALPNPLSRSAMNKICLRFKTQTQTPWIINHPNSAHNIGQSTRLMYHGRLIALVNRQTY